jgi:acetyl-CoA acetyltransferase
MIANRYLHEHGATPEQLARIAVHQRDNACRNPDAYFYRQPITVDDVLDSPMVAYPLHFLEIVMPSAGAAALVVVHPDLVRSSGRPAAWLLGAGECVTHKTITYAPSLSDTAIRPAADRASPSPASPGPRWGWPRCTTATRSRCW